MDKLADAIARLAEAFTFWAKGADGRRLRSAVDIADRIFKRIKELNVEDKTVNKWISEFYDRVA